MIRVGGGIWSSAALWAVLFVGGTATPAAAESLTFRNDSKAAIVVQVVSIFRGVFRRDHPYLLQPGDSTKPGVTLLGDKVITIYDADVPNRMLFQGAIPADVHDRQFRIVPDEPSRVRLVPLTNPPQ